MGWILDTRLRDARQDGRAILFLQGPASPLFRYMAEELERLGHGCWRINICAGDRLFWRRRSAVNFRGSLADWPAFLDDFLVRHRISEIVLLGEERPHHRVAHDVAAARGATVYVVEKGYLRPDWIAIEYDGSGASSHFPADPAHILAAAADLPAPDLRQRYSHTFFQDAARDVAFNLANVFLPFLHPHYRWHALEHPLAEYAGWLGKFATARGRARRTAQALARLRTEPGPYVLFPLQLQTDYQLRAQSPFVDQEQAIEMVLRSFAAHAPSDLRLLAKVHPLDNGLVDWADFTARTAQALGVADRVFCIHDADLSEIMADAQAVVTINSTSGVQALMAGKPVKVLGTAIYDVPGLTEQRPIDRFWREPAPVDPMLRDAFLRLLAGALHERGDFYCEDGARAGAAALAGRIHRRTVNLPGGYVEAPPRPRPQKYPKSPPAP